MAEQETPKELLVSRLKRIEGQIRGIQKMMEGERQKSTIVNGNGKIGRIIR